MSEPQNTASPKSPLTALDRAIQYVSPTWAARRTRARLANITVTAMMGENGFWGGGFGYTGASHTRRATRDWSANWPRSADDEMLWDLPTLRARSRDLVRNSPIATGAILTNQMNIIGTGLTLKAVPDWEYLKLTKSEAQAWQKNVQREFRSWAECEECDATNTQNFYGLQNLIFRSFLESGDCFVNLPMMKNPDPEDYALQLQVIEADRVINPPGIPNSLSYINAGPGANITGGIEVDAQGAPVAYHVAVANPYTTAYARATVKTVRVPAYGGPNNDRKNILHIFERTRPGQSRGVPYLAPVIEPLKQLDRYTEAELMAAVISGMLAVFVKTDLGEGFSAPMGPGANPQVRPDTEIRLESGTITDLRPGESIDSVAPGRPNQAFDPFVQAVLRQVGTALGLPFEVLVKHFTSSYSAARAALLEAWRFFKSRRDFIASKLCYPVYEMWLDEAVAMQRVIAPGYFEDPRIRRAYLGSEWIGDAQGQIDPTKEIDAATKRVLLRVSSRRRETMELSGAEWDDVEAELAEEDTKLALDGAPALIPSTAVAERGTGVDPTPGPGNSGDAPAPGNGRN